MARAGKGEAHTPTTFFFGVRVDNLHAEAALSIISAYAAHRGATRSARKVFFTNVHTISVARRDRAMMRMINQADLVLPDGIGLKIAGKIFRQPILENLNGTDFTPRVLERTQREGRTLYLFGAEKDANERCTRELRRRYPALRILGAHHGRCTPEEEAAMIAEINALHPDILLVALGSPLQERWIEQHAHTLDVGVCMAIGGLFDFMGGVRKRAPGWIRKIGCEWLFRFFQDPRTKWDRVFIEIPEFMMMMVARALIPRGFRSLFQRGYRLP